MWERRPFVASTVQTERNTTRKKKEKETRVSAHTLESESDELEEEEDESLELSEAMPVDSCRSTLSASTARSGRSCFRMLKAQMQPGFTSPVPQPCTFSWWFC